MVSSFHDVEVIFFKVKLCNVEASDLPLTVISTKVRRLTLTTSFAKTIYVITLAPRWAPSVGMASRNGMVVEHQT